MRPLKLSQKPFCIGFPGAMKCQITLLSCAQANMAFEVNSVPLSETIMPGLPRRLINAVSSRATRRPEIEVSGIAARHSRVTSSTKQVVGLVVPTGYSFNLDGTNIYMTLATLFIAQALHVDLSWGQLLTILLVAMLTSKGASGVTGAGFVTLAGTLAAADARLRAGACDHFWNRQVHERG